MTRINTNTGSLIAQNRLNRTNADLQQSLTRLSTGLRINTGKDDPAGLIASEALRSDITSLNKAISNTKRASQIIATADSALGQVSSLLNNVRGLVVEAANAGALSDSEIAANQLQVDSSLEAINRIARTTTFQGRNLLDGSLDFLTQAGTNFTNIKDLKIDQANLGPTGQLGVNVSVSQAAQQAQVAVDDVTTPVTAVAATGSLTLQSTTAAAGAERTLSFTQTVAGTTSTTGSISIGGGSDFSLTTNDQTDTFNGKTVTVQTTAAGNFSSITVDDNTGNIVVTLEEGKTLTAIAADLAGHSDFTFTLGTDGGGNITNAATGTGTFDNLGTEATTETATINVVADVGGAANFNFNVTTGAVPPVNPTATFNSGTNAIDIVVGTGGATNLEAITEAINGIGGFTATLDDPDGINYYDPAADTTDNGTLTAPVAASTLTAAINLTANATGTAANGDTITFATGAVSSPTVSVASNGNLTVTVSNSGSTSISDIIDAINAQGTYTAAAATGNTLTSVGTGATSTSVAFANGVAGVTGGISQDVVFELLGKSGSEVFNVKAGTTINELVSQINLVSDATGVSAQVDPDDGTRLLLNSTAYGSDAFVDLRIIKEGTGGTFSTAVGAGSRDIGSDIVAKINGVDANGRGNSLSINTASLALSLTVAEGSSADINFNITGGGALFQLGGDVVSNQQARVGISSVSTAKLGGVSGRLFQLGSGENASLDTDPNLAANIIDEAISQVTGLRGRLGAFQATTLDSNLASLNDTVANLTEAESSIRDADFAQESARLTRAQILVQSGTTVLGIANQSPQNVLSLLRQ